MSIVTVAREFKAFTNDLKLTNREARKLLTEARKGGVTAKEAALVGKYAENAVTADPRVVRLSKDGFFAAPSTKKMLEEFAVRYTPTVPSPKLPSGEQLERLYTNLAKQRLEDGAGKPLSGPPVSNPNDYPSYNMTPPGLMDVTKTLFVIDNRLIHRTSGWGPNGITSRWQDLGPAPMF
ncbi:MAG: hypothetical protein JNK82_21565 [Myxococcaceae bacterium]|nr:hypothetical protein [Myxococcaceae bacterium]